MGECFRLGEWTGLSGWLRFTFEIPISWFDCEKFEEMLEEEARNE